MEIFRKFHRNKINKLCKDDKKYDIFISSYCHGDETNQRKFSFFKIFNIMAMWSSNYIATTAMKKK